LVAEPEESPEERLEETEKKKKSSTTRDAYLRLSRSRRKIDNNRRRVLDRAGEAVSVQALAPKDSRGQPAFPLRKAIDGNEAMRLGALRRIARLGILSRMHM
jgi:hypothetical protein